MSDHPSRMALDCYALGVPDDAIEAHLTSCGRCRDHVEASRADPGAPPAALLARARPRRAGPALLGAVVLALAAGLALAVLPSTSVPDDGEPYTAAKGEPTLQLWVQRGDEVFPWAGDPVRPGDALRLEVSAPGNPRVEVRSDDLVLYDGYPEGDGFLPPTWGVDAEGRAEIMSVRLIDGPYDDWHQTLVVPKERAR